MSRCDDVPDECDVLIAGGGMVGASLAVALSALSLRVLLVEGVPFAAPGQPSFDARTIALSRGSARILDTLGLWQAVAPVAAAIRRIHVSQRGRFGCALISAAEAGVPALGHVVENRVLGEVLWQRLRAAGPSLAVKVPATVAGVEGATEGFHVRLDTAEGPAALHARLLVVADGSRSRLREALGIAAHVRPYGQTAIIGNVAVSGGDADDVAYERFTPEGPLALLPAGPGRVAFVLTRPTRTAPAVMALDDEAFIGLLQREAGYRAGRFTHPGRRVAYPLDLVQAARITAGSAVLVGNAAHGLHPVAAQGYNLGLRDVAALAELIADGLYRGGARVACGREMLAGYAQWRRRDQRAVVTFTDGLVRLFDLPGAPVAHLRGVGLLAFGMWPGARRWLARETMGLGGRLPRLARGLPL